MSSFTVEDYYKLNVIDGSKCELLNGLFEMSPAPRTMHQRIGARLFVDFFQFFDGTSCEVFQAPCDVKLGENIVQPDIFVVCDQSKITEIRCEGIPDLIVEILSPNNRKLDLNEKFKLYEKFGLQEYWIVDPDEEWVAQWVLRGDKFILKETYGKSDIIVSQVFQELKVGLVKIFK